MKQTIAKHLLEIKAVYLQPNDPFTWSSGLKSPIYCDNRLTLSFPSIRTDIAEGLSALIKDYYPEVEVVAGTATAGIPHAAWVSDKLNLPMCYVRSKAKGHGKGNQIEGKIERGAQVVIIEDLISTGGSVINVANALRDVEANLLGVVAIFSYGLEKGKKMLQEAGLNVHTLTDLDALLAVASKLGAIDEEGIQLVKKWRENPADWQV